ncbi:MAG: hypothetical protein WCI74_05235, partial [Actinomycetes bacterium]
MRRATLLALVFFAAATWPTAALGAVWTEGTAASPFRLADAGGLLVRTVNGDPSIAPPWGSAPFDGSGFEFEPRSVRQDAKDGSFLVACGKHGYIQRIMPDGVTMGRRYTLLDIPGLMRPFDAYPLADGMMVVDRGAAQGEGSVFRVNSANQVIWRFGGKTGPGAGQLFDPFTAEPVGQGHTLISDSLGFRVIEVDDATGEIVWSYGKFMVEGPGEGLLRRPHSAQRLDSGNTLICDAEGNRVIEVTPGGSIVWSYGTGVAGPGPGQLANPNSARRFGNQTIISDSDNNRVLVIDTAGAVQHEYGGAVSNPRAALRLADGTTVIADLGNMRLSRYGYRVAPGYVATSLPIDPAVGKQKTFKRITVNASVPDRTQMRTEYSVNGVDWRYVPPDGVLPSSVTGTAIRYRLRMATDDWRLAPSVNDVSVTWEVLTPTKKKPGGGTGTKPSTGTGTTTGVKPTVGARPGTGGSGTAQVQGMAPGAGSQVASGSAGTSGDTASGATNQSTMSGWVMSETKEDVSWAGAAGSSA